MLFPTRTYRARNALAAAALLPAMTAGADVIVLHDGTFLNSEWTMTPNPYGPSGGSGTGVQVLSGGSGDNGAARAITNSCGPNNSGSYNASIYTGFVYQPVIHGPIHSVRISFDARLVDSLCALGAVVEQAGTVWMWGYDIDSPTWTTFAFACDDTDIWYQILPTGTLVGAGPDFSATGAPMHFGFWTGNGSGGGNSGYSTSHLVDNFHVVIDRTPTCPADLDLDGDISGTDLGLLLGNWGGAGTGDLNGDGQVDGTDLGLLLGAWGPCV